MAADVLVPAGAAPAGTAVVVAVDALIDRERHADELVLALCRAIGDGVVFGATHWAEAGGVRHVAVTVEASGVPEDRVLDAVRGVLRDRADLAEPAVGVGERVEGPTGLALVLTAAAEAHRARSSGRVVVFPVGAAVDGEVTAGALVAASAIDRVEVLAEGEASLAAVVRTRGFLRPRWEAGSLVLHVQPAAGGALVPFEVPDPTPCCAVHA